ncbi:MAG: hypothetical protein QE271_03255 [Bacteriovoracaceae bacterium]|nr:hypothetical protein [Bacteriovoracaceae bacterium]
MSLTMKKRTKLKKRSLDLLRRMFNRNEIEKTASEQVRPVVKKTKKLEILNQESQKVELNSMRKVLSYFVDYDGNSKKYSKSAPIEVKEL